MLQVYSLVISFWCNLLYYYLLPYWESCPPLLLNKLTEQQISEREPLILANLRATRLGSNVVVLERFARGTRAYYCCETICIFASRLVLVIYLCFV
jgi:hypothetical protein